MEFDRDADQAEALAAERESPDARQDLLEQPEDGPLRGKRGR